MLVSNVDRQSWLAPGATSRSKRLSGDDLKQQSNYVSCICKNYLLFCCEFKFIILLHLCGNIASDTSKPWKLFIILAAHSRSCCCCTTSSKVAASPNMVNPLCMSTSRLPLVTFKILHETAPTVLAYLAADNNESTSSIMGRAYYSLFLMKLARF